MTPSQDPSDAPGLTRRTLIGSAAAAGGLGLLGMHATAVAAPAPGDVPEALDPPVDGLTYISLDAFAFHVADTASSRYRLYQDLTGMQPQPASTWINAPLTIPIGSVVKQINVGYQGQPIVSIVRRDLTGALTDLSGPTSLAAGGGAKTQSLSVNATLVQNGSYSVRAFCSIGDSVYGMTIGYVPPAQAFVPFAGSDPRALDTRTTTKLAADEERVVDLSAYLVSTARAAVLNVTATETNGPSFLAVYRDGIAYPGTSSVNWTAAGATVANGVISSVTAGKVKIKAGPAGTNVIVDVVGSLL